MHITWHQVMKNFLNDVPSRSAIKRFCDFLHNIVDRNIIELNIGNPLFFDNYSLPCVSAECDLQDALLHIIGLRYFTSSYTWGIWKMWHWWASLVCNLAPWFWNLRSLFIWCHHYLFMMWCFIIERMIFFKLIIKLKSFWIFVGILLSLW